jgi:sugar-specific transcriptional regulator TrmB
MNLEALKRIGLTESDRKVYLSLLRLGKASVTEIAHDSGIHRTNVYNILDKLGEIGLTANFNEHNKLFFKATNPENLLNYLRETEQSIQGIIPDLKKMQESVSEKVNVEVFHGEKGMKAAYKDVLRTGEEVLGFGMAGQFRSYFPEFSQQWIRDMNTGKIKNKYIYVKGTAYKDRYFEAKTISKDLVTPVATHIYGDKVMIAIWSPALVSIIIRSKEVADNFRKYFEILWKSARN